VSLRSATSQDGLLAEGSCACPRMVASPTLDWDFSRIGNRGLDAHRNDRHMNASISEIPMEVKSMKRVRMSLCLFAFERFKEEIWKLASQCGISAMQLAPASRSQIDSAAIQLTGGKKNWGVGVFKTFRSPERENDHA